MTKSRPEMIPDVFCSSTGKGVGGLGLTLVSEDLWPWTSCLVCLDMLLGLDELDSFEIPR